MIAIPLTKNFSWRNPPLITIGLILINCFIFVVFQYNDDRHQNEANKFYFASGLFNLEKEFYQIYFAEQKRAIIEKEDPDTKYNEQEKQVLAFRQINGETGFLEQLNSGRVISETDPRMERWRQLRSEFNARLNKVIAFKYGFRPAYAQLFTSITCMFLHAGWAHLIGNMIFLWLIGCLIEYGCRHITLPIIYLLGGMAGTGLFWLLNPSSTGPLVGASGAIAGIMGAFTVFYGFKKVRIFLSLGFYFNYLTFSAIWLLPLWAANELLQMLFNSNSPVAYAAHLGGLGFGAVLAYGARRLPGCLDEDAFAAVVEDKAAPLLECALAHIGALRFNEARPLLEEILQHEPDNLAARQHLYTIDRQNPAEPQYHQTTSNLLTLLCRQAEHFEKACAVFRDYLKTAKPPKLSADQYIRISQCFVATGNCSEAQRILFSLIKKAPHIAGLPTALFKLSQGFQNDGRKIERIRCLKLLQQHFPMSSEARAAFEQLKKQDS
ncbi:MAG: rhomboid family intramembrane serine protease [Desulfobacteraceae bacterium]|nr:MAG: rhomboid family intramembrane serine protease [Desulfobacteraceae bacterium]